MSNLTGTYKSNNTVISPIAYATVNANGTSNFAYNCTVTGTNPYTITITNPTGSNKDVCPIATIIYSSGYYRMLGCNNNGSTGAKVLSTSQNNGNSRHEPSAFNIVIYGE